MITIKVTLDLYNEIKNYYSPYVLDCPKGEYVDYISKTNNTVITGFLSKKEIKSVTFNGKNELEEAQKWDFTATPNVKKKSTESKYWVDLDDQIGSDEVGVGDLFLPMIVVATYVSKSQIKELKELGVNDSKKLTDEKIKELGPILIKKFDYSKLTLSNEEYNRMLTKSQNLNSLKAKMHNRALANIKKRHDNAKHIFVDQFVKPTTYYAYFDETDKPIVEGITFHTKGESYYPSVALSSVLARYALLKEKEKLDEKYHMNFPFGAGIACDKFLTKIKKKLDKSEIDNLVKINFKNYKD